ncbi:uncharacterized protein LOC112604046 isoform X3 [Melanaphis sacchari]|uniref:uncharacterized protein LOC112604046 isoform X3 n=1 Tax=Melanaphis sacchari TaxID=742174 RepID=UPI000DC153FB|nr:uncharacterized protein LOC112604046 isoform X3 [Melanaphis sacchari]
MDGNTRNNSWNRFLEENVTRASVKIKQEDEEHMLDMPSDKIKQEDEEYMLDMPSVSEQSALPSVPEQPAQLPVTLFVIGFECAMCHEKVMEIRSFPCEHSVCFQLDTNCLVANYCGWWYQKIVLRKNAVLHWIKELSIYSNKRKQKKSLY